jgi:outer membrane protein assembly factor BamB
MSGGAVRQEVDARAKLDFTPFVGNGIRTELTPVLAGDVVLVTSTLRLFAFDARTTELRWSAGPSEGWDELKPATRNSLFTGVNMRQVWIGPATSGRVAVAALQVPLSRHAEVKSEGFRIVTPIPERRLFAFEIDTGRALWDHAPPPDWNGASGSLAQNMSLCASPTIIGDRVLVPCVSDESSIDYHVACYTLTTGKLLWSTLVARGQMERNTKGKLVFEFAAAPLVGVPGRDLALAQTGLGLVAAVDITTGEVLWRSEYTPIEVPKARGYSRPSREVVWRTTPPIVVGSVVLATPPDSRELLALDLEDGRQLWTIWNRALGALDAGTRLLAFDHLIGAGEDTLYLGGNKVSALRKPGGLRSTKAFEPLWTELVERPDLSGRARLTREEVLLPGPIECLVRDRESGGERGSLAMHATPCGLLVTDGAIYALADDGLHRIER